MLVDQLNLAANSFKNVNRMSLHTADPGSTGASQSNVTRQPISWSSAVNGVITAQVTFPDVSGTFTHIGLWENTAFVQGRPLNVTLPSAQNLIVEVEFSVSTNFSAPELFEGGS
jgi:hypothetical protein